MFDFKQKHNKELYNNLVKLSRNLYFYNTLKFKDDFFTRVILIFIHFSLILRNIKSIDKKKLSQNLYDDLFFFIECHLRESGLGDVSVNSKMKNLNRIFYDISLKIDYENGESLIKKKLMSKYLYENRELSEKSFDNFNKYLKEFRSFCDKNDINKILNNKINFNYGSS
tara:strand:- start:139 stop:645 length:507 start_codon:yes stop_codon:yes gene_type:complete